MCCPQQLGKLFSPKTLKVKYHIVWNPNRSVVMVTWSVHVFVLMPDSNDFIESKQEMFSEALDFILHCPKGIKLCSFFVTSVEPIVDSSSMVSFVNDYQRDFKVLIKLTHMLYWLVNQNRICKWWPYPGHWSNRNRFPNCEWRGSRYMILLPPSLYIQIRFLPPLNIHNFYHSHSWNFLIRLYTKNYITY